VEDSAALAEEDHLFFRLKRALERKRNGKGADPAGSRSGAE
jgi:hypothetical protein